MGAEAGEGGDVVLANGHYKTAAGSEMWISGEHGGISRVVFNWCDEAACCDCVPEAYEVDGRLIWHCGECGGGSAEWEEAA